MGVEYKAKVVVGARVPKGSLYETKRVKAFAHNHPEDWEVDPKTKKPLWREEDVFLLEKAGVLEDDYDWREGGKKDAKAVMVTETRGDDDGDNVFIGRHVVGIDLEGGEPKALKGVNMLEEAKFLEGLLAPHDLWNEREFGIWLVGDVSC